MPRTGYQADQGGRYFLTGSLKVNLTKDEKEWLGRSVRRSDGFIGQVWCLGRPGRRGGPGSVWVVADQVATEVDIADLQVVANRPNALSITRSGQWLSVDSGT